MLQLQIITSPYQGMGLMRVKVECMSETFNDHGATGCSAYA